MDALPATIQSFAFGNIVVKLCVPLTQTLRNNLPRSANAAAPAPFPYWARLWPAARALSQFIATNIHLIADKNVLELAAGLGLPGLLAAHYARKVILSDYVPESVVMMQASVAINDSTNVTCRQLDWYQLPPHLNADVLLLSDINYDPAAFEILFKMLLEFLNKGTTIILSTPQRLMAGPFVARLLPFSIRQEEIEIVSEERTFVTLLVLRKPLGDM